MSGRKKAEQIKRRRKLRASARRKTESQISQLKHRTKAATLSRA
jgi:hypothetical protein